MCAAEWWRIVNVPTDTSPPPPTCLLSPHLPFQWHRASLSYISDGALMPHSSAVSPGKTPLKVVNRGTSAELEFAVGLFVRLSGR